MLKRLLMLAVGLGSVSPVMAQHYLTLGAGYSTMWYNSDDLDRFTTTYNQVNGASLVALLQNFGTGEGIRWELGYRRVRHFSAAIAFGLQNYTGNTVAQYNNGEYRELKLGIHNFIVESEAGLGLEKFFVNAVVTGYFDRKLTLETSYSAPADSVPTPLTGTYKGNASFGADVGLAFGVCREPFFLVAKILYPIHTGGSSHILRDPSPAKTADGLSNFPDDYVSYVLGEPYKGVASDVDGLKILVSFAFSLRIGL